MHIQNTHQKHINPYHGWCSTKPWVSAWICGAHEKVNPGRMGSQPSIELQWKNLPCTGWDVFFSKRCPKYIGMLAHIHCKWAVTDGYWWQSLRQFNPRFLQVTSCLVLNIRFSSPLLQHKLWAEFVQMMCFFSLFWWPGDMKHATKAFFARCWLKYMMFFFRPSCVHVGKLLLQPSCVESSHLGD